MLHLLYKITNIVNERFYVGIHSTKNRDDGYFGSGKRIKNEILKYGIQNFDKEIIAEFPNREELLLAEMELVDEELLANPKCLNLKCGGEGGWEFVNINNLNSRKGAKVSEETKKKLSEARKHFSGFSDEARSKMSSNSWVKTDEGRNFMSSVLSGKTKSDAHKRKISESLKRRHQEKLAGLV